MSDNAPAKQSDVLVRGPHRAGARAMLKAVGFDDEALKKPLIGVANTWIEIGPCNYHLRELAAAVKEGIRAAGGTPMEFNTVSISDGITMGTDGMTIVCDVDETSIRRVEANVYKLVNVLRVDDLTTLPSVERELAMIKVAASPESRSQVMHS